MSYPMGNPLQPDYGSDGVLLGYQRRWVADKSAVKIGEKSRRIGLTWGEAADNVLIAAASGAAGGMDVWYLGYNQEMTREYIDTCAEWAKILGEAASAAEEVLLEDENGDKSIQAFRIRFASGHKITALPSKPSVLRGKQGLVVIDEAAFHDDLEEVLKAAFALLIWGGAVHIISTHDGVDNPFNTLVQDVRAGRKPYSLHRIDFDDALRDGLYKRICQKKKQNWSVEDEAKWREEIIRTYGAGADEELFCIPAEGSGAYLAADMIERRTEDGIPVVRWGLPDSATYQDEASRQALARAFCEDVLQPLLDSVEQQLQHFIGGDFARSGDLSVFWPVALLPDLRRRPPFIVELRNVPFEVQRDILFYIVDRLPRFVAGALDATGNGAYLAEVAAQRYGELRIAQVKITESWYRETMPKFKAAFEDHLMVLPRDAEVVADHRAIRLVRGVAQIQRESRGSKSEGQKGKQQRHGDSAIANVMAYFASLMPVEEYDYTPVANTSGRDEDYNDAPLRARFSQGAF